MASSYSNFTDPSRTQNSSKVVKDMLDLQMRLTMMAEEFGNDDDDEDAYSSSDSFQEEDKENQAQVGSIAASTSWHSGGAGTRKERDLEGSKSHPSVSSSYLHSTIGSSSFCSSQGKDRTQDSENASSKIGTTSSSSLYSHICRSPSAATGKTNSSVSAQPSLVAVSAERQKKPALPEPAKSDLVVDKKGCQEAMPKMAEKAVEIGKPEAAQMRQAVSMSGLGADNKPQTERFATTPETRMAKKRQTHQFVINEKSYDILNVIGKGGSSEVYEVIDREESKVVAVKRVDLEGADADVRKAFLNEINLLEKLKHTHRVVELLDYEHRQSENVLFVVMEKGETDFSTHLKRRRKEPKFENLVAAYWQEMLLAVQVIHNQGIVHADLKPSNFLLVGGTFKLIDFGIARAVPKDVTSVTMNCQMGTLNYMSPEAMNNISTGAGTDTKYKVPLKSDVWSLGCILYSMVYGRTPFQHITNTWQKMMAIMGGNPNRPVQIEFPTKDYQGKEIDKLLMGVMKRCLRRNWKNRPSVDELLEDPYLQNKNKTPEAAGSAQSSNLLRSLAGTVWENTPRTNDRLVKQLLGEMQKRNIAEEL